MQCEPLDLSVRRNVSQSQYLSLYSELKHNVSADTILTLSRCSSPAQRRRFTIPDVSMKSSINRQKARMKGNTVEN